MNIIKHCLPDSCRATERNSNSISTDVNDLIKHFLVPDSCRATEKNDNSISADVTDDTIENN